jgi:hypothetical protein
MNFVFTGLAAASLGVLENGGYWRTDFKYYSSE